jgi:hypothetical protein
LSLEFSGLVAAASQPKNAVPLTDLIQFRAIDLELFLIIKVEGHGGRQIRRTASRHLEEEQLLRGSICEGLIVHEPVEQKKGMDAGRPFVMPRADQLGLLLLVEFVKGPRVGLVIILKVVAGMIILVLDQQHRRVLGPDLLFNRDIHVKIIQSIVDAEAGVVVIVQVQTVGSVAISAELGKRLMEHSVRARGAGTRPAHSSSIRIGFTDQRLTAYGGLAFWSGFLHKRKVRQELAAVLPHEPTSPNAYAPTDVALSLMGGIICGADKLSRVAYLRQDPAIAQVLGVEAVASQSTLSRF